MVTIGMNYRVLPGKETVFENAFQRVVDALNKAAGHGRSHLYRNVHNSNSYLILSEWFDENAFNTFVKSEAFLKVTNWGKEQILAERPNHQIYR